MSLSPGTRLGSYEITAPIGAGGMGEVYRAKDTKLNRDAALKILPESFTSDPDRRARFTREAQVLASLNHPNIAGIYGIEDSSGETAAVRVPEDEIRGTERAVLAGWPVGRVRVGSIGPIRDLPAAVSCVCWSIPGVDDGRDRGAMAAGRQGALLHRAGQQAHGRVDLYGGDRPAGLRRGLRPPRARSRGARNGARLSRSFSPTS